MSAGIHPTITLDLAASALGDRRRTARSRSQRVAARAAARGARRSSGA